MSRSHESRDERAFRVLLWCFVAGVLFMVWESARQFGHAAGWWK